eukprot:Cvel_17921.t1-p1 / transcript=Cvel_17921.t1 / gene=Cvel_17921 / organism=Chromera_velia_CCMP2878 / gene_product=Fibrillin-1, putative / transcript_product=Fibrillin-1, putative / location=Cvel_scaffold1456:16-8877(-) / protein_length=347 / sequence_SO=supercontig / SO=protein_coding / is_pseudo=false
MRAGVEGVTALEGIQAGEGRGSCILLVLDCLTASRVGRWLGGWERGCQGGYEWGRGAEAVGLFFVNLSFRGIKVTIAGETIKQAAAGRDHSVALTNSGKVFVTGEDNYGSLGLGGGGGWELNFVEVVGGSVDAITTRVDPLADTDECTGGSHNCHAQSTCTNTVGSFTCSCNSGFSGDGVSCSNIDECSTSADDCHADATCTDNSGSFSCACNTGFSGSGVACADIDECGTASHDCNSNAACGNSAGSFSCSCNAGWSGTGVACTNIDECGTSADDCHADATCTDNSGSFSCACNTGFSGSGVACANIDECGTSADDCHADATCTDNSGSFSCACNTGFSGSGVACA